MTTKAQIAKDLAHFIWQSFGKLLAHLGLFTAAYKGVDATQHLNPGWLAWLNPWTKIKKMLAWGVVEGAAYTVSEPAAKAWNYVAPISEGFMEPIIAYFIDGPIDYAVKQGYITLNETISAPSNASWYRYVNPSNAAHGVESFFQTQWNFITNYWSSWFYPAKPVSPIYDKAVEYAPKVGKFVADGIEYSWDKISYCNPTKVGNFIEAMSEATGMSYVTLLAVSAGVGTLAFFGLKSLLWGNSSSAKATATATGGNANGNQVNINVGTDFLAALYNMMRRNPNPGPRIEEVHDQQPHDQQPRGLLGHN